MGSFAKRNTKYQEILDASMAQPEPGMELVVGKALPQHEDYMKLCMKWRFLDSSYRGGAKYKNCKDSEGGDVLIRHEQESEKAWARRKRMSTLHNFCRPVVDKMVGFVFGHAVSRDTTPAYDEFQGDVDGHDTCMHEFMRRAVLRSCVLDRWYIMLDTTKPEPKMTQAQAKAAGSRILLKDLDPIRVINWREDEYLVTDETIGEFGGARLWDDETYQVVELAKDGKIASILPPVPHGWSSCPIIPVVPHCSGESLVEDVAEHQMAIFNLDSIHKEELAKQTFSQWWLAGSQITVDMLQSADVGSRKVLILPVDAQTVKFERLASDPSQAESIRAAMAAEVQEIYRTLGLKDPTTETGPESGRALKIRFTETAFRATEISDMSEDAEEKITELVGDALGVEFEGPEYPDDFDDESIAEELQSTLSVISANLPPSMKRAQAHKWGKLAFGRNLEQDEMEEMSQEIEAQWPSGMVENVDLVGQAQPDDTEMGAAKEMAEHDIDRATALKLAKDHLKQDPSYYKTENLDQRKYQNPAYAPGSKAPKGPMIG
jgi:hypothetical protein